MPFGTIAEQHVNYFLATAGQHVNYFLAVSGTASLSC